MTKQLKRTFQQVLLCCGMTLFSNCQQVEIENVGSNALTMSLIANIGNFSEVPDSRYTGDDPNNVQFGGSDSIGVFMDGKDLLKWTYGLSGWTTNEPVYWPDKEDTHEFHAFYPYASATSIESIPMPDLRNQTGTLADVSKCDFLVANTAQSYGTTGTVLFQGDGKSFRHVSTLLKLIIKGDDDLKASVLERISIEGTNIVAPTTYSFVDKSVSLFPDAYSNVLDTSLEHEMNETDAVFYFIVNEKKDASSVVTLTIEYRTDGKSYVAQMENFAGNLFAGNTAQSYTLTVKDRTLLITGAEILPWGKGETLDNIVINGSEKK